MTFPGVGPKKRFPRPHYKLSLSKNWVEMEGTGDSSLAGKGSFSPDVPSPLGEKTLLLRSGGEASSSGPSRSLFISTESSS
ncbi:hypothetical protein LIER_29845 [Lithospermum erythrorhizon]|uniref:Uncharacterized protein n=1 Tax=Lithospermum erythrorhizon TaxID=34254 RepID=A0AAV3RKL2_LITER